MATAESIPDVVVGVDLGTSSTDLLYENDSLIKWGNLIEIKDITTTQNKYKHNHGVPSTDAAVDRLFQDYLSELHSYLVHHLEKAWRNKLVHFIFSVPTTWNDEPHVVQRFRTSIRKARFGSKGGLNHKAFIGDTEAVAAAMYSVQTQEYSAGEIILVCDAGGGTTDHDSTKSSQDLALLKVTSARQGAPSFDILYAPAGYHVGSCDIDEGFMDLVLDRFKGVQQDAKFCGGELGPSIALAVVNGSAFQTAKMMFGEDKNSMGDFLLHFPIPGFPDMDYINDDEGISRGVFILPNSKLQALFDSQIEKLVKIVDKTLSYMECYFKSEQVSHFVLSGGLGSSPYVQRRIKEYLEQSRETHLSIAGVNLKALPQFTAQACVSEGLVHKEIEQLTRGVIRNDVEKLCNSRSYGIEVIEKYNPKLHDKTRMFSDPNSKKSYVRTIKWIIESNRGYRTDEPYEQSFHFKVKEEMISRIDVKLYMSAPNNKPGPESTATVYPESDGVEFLQDLKVDLLPSEPREMSLWSRFRPTTEKLTFRIVAELNGIDLVFRLKYANHESRPTQPVRSDWQEYKGDCIFPFSGAG